ncbi:MAG: hypothetical protein ACREB3_00535, partial [Burkholderiales bacterium]
MGVPVKIWGSAVTNYYQGEPGELDIYGTALDTSPGANDGDFDLYGIRYSAGSFTAPNKTVFFEPGKSYSVSVMGLTVTSLSMYVTPPPGYQVEIDGVPRELVSATVGSGSGYFYAHTYIVRVSSPRQDFSGRAGTASPISADKLHWQVSLGYLKNGGSARSLAIIDAATASSWSSLFTPAGLQYAPPSSEVYVYRDGSSNIRQIIANQAAVDVVTNGATQYELRFYHPQQVQGSTYPRTFTGQPYVTYRIEQGATATTLKITSETRNITDFYATNNSIVRTAVASLARTGTWPAFTWTLGDWDTNPASPLVEEVSASSGTTQSRSASAAVQPHYGAPVLNSTLNYTLFGWGEEPTGVTRGTGANSLSTSYAYYSDSTQPGSYGFVNSVTYPGGGWEAYDYWNASATSTNTGRIKYHYRPYNSAPSTASHVATQGEVTYFEYLSDPFGMLTRPSLIQTSVNNTLTAKSVIAYSDVGTVNGATVTQAVRKDYSDSTNYLTTTAKFYREDTADDFLRNQVHS